MIEPRSRPGSPGLTVPHAILIGSVVIACGLYFGLRASPTEHPSPAAVTPAPTTTAAASVAETRATTSAPDASAKAPVDVTTASRAAARSLEAQKASLVEKCWRPAEQTKKRPDGVTYLVNFTFGADGQQITRGITEPRDAARPGLANCLQLALQPIEVPPPGEPVAFEVPLALP